MQTFDDSFVYDSPSQAKTQSHIKRLSCSERQQTAINAEGKHKQNGFMYVFICVVKIYGF